MTSTVDAKYKTEMTWEEKAQANPLYAVMSINEFKSRGGDAQEWSQEDLELFYEKGQYIYEINLKPLLRRADLPGKDTFIVEYGSGMGRILKAIKADGYRCAGVDISKTMIDHSLNFVPEVRELYVLNAKGLCGIPSGSADVVFSYAVLQHIDTLSRVRIALSEMCRICKPGGRLRFEIFTPERPFGDPAGSAPLAVLNGETDTVVISIGAPGGSPHANVKTLTHTHWNGVPLSLGTVRTILEEFGVYITGISQDVRQDIMFWIDAKKASPASDEAA